jgi:hypothetical protein
MTFLVSYQPRVHCNYHVLTVRSHVLSLKKNENEFEMKSMSNTNIILNRSSIGYPMLLTVFMFSHCIMTKQMANVLTQHASIIVKSHLHFT